MRRDDAGRQVRQGDGGAGHGGALFVGHVAEDGGGVELGVRGGREQKAKAESQTGRSRRGNVDMSPLKTRDEWKEPL